MTIHYHGLPINPKRILETLSSGFFCASIEQVTIPYLDRAHQIAQGIMLDCGAYTKWTQGGGDVDVQAYWAWAERWLDCPTTWAVVPDKIDGNHIDQERLLAQTPHEIKRRPHKLGVVWHLHDPIEHLVYWAGWYPRICFGSSAQYSEVGSEAWHRRVGEAFDRLYQVHRYPPMIHMLRGMKCTRPGWPYPFHSVDSADIARNHNVGPESHARFMMDDWNGCQCPPKWHPQPQHEELFGGSECIA